MTLDLARLSNPDLVPNFAKPGTKRDSALTYLYVTFDRLGHESTPRQNRNGFGR